MPKNVKNSCDKQLGMKLKLLRIKKRLKKKDIAKLLNVSPQQMHKYETGQNRISLSTFITLKDTVDFDVLEFLTMNNN